MDRDECGKDQWARGRLGRRLLGLAALALLAACAAPLRDDAGARLPPDLTGGVVPGNRVKNLLRLADAEWRRWGGQVVRIGRDDRVCALVVGGTCEVVDDGCGQEQNVALCPVVDEYWSHIRRTGGGSFTHDCSRTGVCEYRLPPGVQAIRTPAWSAAFLSTLMHQAGFGPEEFLPSPFHANYVVAARDGMTAAYAVAPAPAYIEPGDIICATRFADRPQFTGSEIALLTPDSPRSAATPMHCDLVVAVDLSQRRARAIGGNVMQSVSLNDIALDAEGRLSAEVNSLRHWLLVMKLRPQWRAAN